MTSSLCNSPRRPQPSIDRRRSRRRRNPACFGRWRHVHHSCVGGGDGRALLPHRHARAGRRRSAPAPSRFRGDVHTSGGRARIHLPWPARRPRRSTVMFQPTLPTRSRIFRARPPACSVSARRRDRRNCSWPLAFRRQPHRAAAESQRTEGQAACDAGAQISDRNLGAITLQRSRPGFRRNGRGKMNRPTGRIKNLAQSRTPAPAPTPKHGHDWIARTSADRSPKPDISRSPARAAQHPRPSRGR